MGGGRISSSARPGNFLDFLRTSRKFPRNTVILPSPYRKRFPPWAYAKLPYRAWENCSEQCLGLFRAQKRKITMTSKENRNFCHSVAVWTWRVYSIPPTAVCTYMVYTFHRQQKGCAGGIHFRSQQYGRAWCIPFHRQ
jgi:hypothetical protein